MSKPRTETELSDALDSNLTWRIREISDLKRAILDANPVGREVLLKALVAVCYAHWEGFVKFSANKYFDFIALRKFNYSSLEEQFYVNAFVTRISSLIQNKPGLQDACALINEIVNSKDKRFAFIHPDLVNTKSNLNYEVVQQICLVCGISTKLFESHANFIDIIMLKRRNAIAHGDRTAVKIEEIDDFVSRCTEMMRIFKNELENKIYSRAYLAQP